MNFKQTLLIAIFVTFLLFAAFFSGYYLRDFKATHFESFPLLTQAYSILEKYGLKPIPAVPSLEHGMIKGMVQAYDDPYTMFIEPIQHELQTQSLQGSFGGIGVQIGQDEQGNLILHPFPDSPASQAGILDGDRLIAVGDLQLTSETDLETIQAAIRGPTGEIVKLTIGHAPDFKPIEIKIKRAEIPLPSVAWHIDPIDHQAGVIQINLIAATTGEEIQKAVKDLESRGAEVFVLDLRNNPGGLLDAGVDVARLFLKDGIVIEQQYRGQDMQSFKVEHPGPLTEIPLSVVINKGSASAAEIIAGALKAHHRAVIVGSPSFGKDTIQLVFDLDDGSSLHVTSAHWWVPGLEPSIGGNGVQPDISIDDAQTSSTTDPVLRAAIKALSENQ